MDGQFWFKIAISVGLGILTGAGFVAAHYPVSRTDEIFHVSQAGESIVLSVAMMVFWGLVCGACSLLAGLGGSPKRWLRVWVVTLLGCLALGVLSATLLGYLTFTGEERDWFKSHDRFFLGEYLAMSVQTGVFYGGVIAAVTIGISSTILALAFGISKRRGKALSVQQR